MRRLQVGLIVAILWAGIYLPGLGSLEFKGEEARRVLPAIHMLDSGDWLVPRLAGQEYFKKPPLINWAVAASFLATGERGEWSARLPSALAVLALGLGIVCIAGTWLEAPGAFLAAIFALTNLGMLEKGRLIEIEAVYVALFGLALVCWMSGWATSKSPWYTWVVPHLFLGLGILTKGPLHLLFFYLTVVLILWRGRRMRDLFSVAHLVGLLVMGGLFAAWFLPYLRQIPQEMVFGKWGGEMGSHIGPSGKGIAWGEWLANVPRGLSNYLPWLFVLPVLWMEPMLARLGERDGAVVRGGRLALLIGFFALSAIPGVVPRYTMPLLVLASLLLGRVLVCNAAALRLIRRIWRGGLAFLIVAALVGGIATLFLVSHSVVPILVAVVAAGTAAIVFVRVIMARSGLCGLTAGTAAVIAVFVMEYSVAIVPRLQLRGKSRHLAETVVEALPPGRQLYGVDPGFHPFLCYLPAGTQYVSRFKALPASAEYIFTRDALFDQALERGWVLEEKSRVRGQDRPASGGPPPELVLARLCGPGGVESRANGVR